MTVRFVLPGGVPDTSQNGRVTIELGSNPARAQLRGPLGVDANQGIASFTGVTLDHAGDGFTLVAWSPGFPDGVSPPFAFTPAPEPREVLGYGCSSGGATGLAAAGLAALLLWRRRLRNVALAIALASAAANAAPSPSPAAPAPSPAETARALNKKGIEALDAGRLDEAIAVFEQLSASVNSPAVIYNLAEAHRRAGHVARALELYHAYLAALPEGSKRADVRDFERLERQQIARQNLSSGVAASSAEERGPPPPRHLFHSPGLSAGLAWLPKEERTGLEALLELRVGEDFRVSAGAIISPRPGARIAVERRLVGDEEWSLGVALRGLVASFPGRRLMGGGGGFSLRFRASENVDLQTGAYLEYFATKGDHFLAPIITAGLGLHL